MKKIALASAGMAMVLVAGSVSAANSLNAGSFSLNVPIITTTPTGSVVQPVANPLISGKYMIGKDMGVLGGFGFNSGGASGATSTTIALMAGVRKYLKTDDFAPFVGGIFEYASTSGGGASTNGLLLAAVAGAEYFMAKQFSVEGKVGFGYTSQDQAGVKTSYFGTGTANVSLNFYF